MKNVHVKKKMEKIHEFVTFLVFTTTLHGIAVIVDFVSTPFWAISKIAVDYAIAAIIIHMIVGNTLEEQDVSEQNGNDSNVGGRCDS